MRDVKLKTKRVYRLEKDFREEMALLGRDDVFIYQTPENRFLVTMPHPTLDAEYILATWGSRDAAREFKDIGRAVNTALKMGAESIRFKLLTPPADLD